MMRYVSIRNLAPLCGVVLGLLVLCNTAVPNILRASDNAGGWVLVNIGDPCWSTTQLWCSAGETWGAQQCGGNHKFSGVTAGSRGTVQPAGGSAWCTTSGWPGSWYCASVVATYCQF
jgi:hypothetical protein